MCACRTIPPTPTTLVASAVDALVRAVLDGPLDPPTEDLLRTASGGDRTLLAALVLTGIGSGGLAVVDRRWCWTASHQVRTSPPPVRMAGRIRDDVGSMSPRQLHALATITGALAEPYVAVLRHVRNEPVVPRLDINLTRREQETLQLLSEGLKAQAIGRRLGLSQRTIEKYQQRIYRKFGTRDRLTTVLRAQRAGLLPAPATR
jgi:DNA-binding CsgD family transcriptional regulator